MIPTIQVQEVYSPDETIEITAQLKKVPGFCFDEQPAEIYLFNQDTHASVSFELPLETDGNVRILIEPGSLKEGEYKIAVRHRKTKVQDSFVVHRPSSK